MTHWAASIPNIASTAHHHIEVQTSKENESKPHFYYFQMAHWAYAVTRILSSQKSDQ
jgi:hypothetical protein